MIGQLVAMAASLGMQASVNWETRAFVDFPLVSPVKRDASSDGPDKRKKVPVPEPLHAKFSDMDKAVTRGTSRNPANHQVAELDLPGSPGALLVRSSRDTTGLTYLLAKAGAAFVPKAVFKRPPSEVGDGFLVWMDSLSDRRLTLRTYAGLKDSVYRNRPMLMEVATRPGVSIRFSELDSIATSLKHSLQEDSTLQDYETCRLTRTVCPKPVVFIPTDEIPATVDEPHELPRTMPIPGRRE